MKYDVDVKMLLANRNSCITEFTACFSMFDRSHDQTECLARVQMIVDDQKSINKILLLSIAIFSWFHDFFGLHLRYLYFRTFILQMATIL